MLQLRGSEASVMRGGCGIGTRFSVSDGKTAAPLQGERFGSTEVKLTKGSAITNVHLQLGPSVSRPGPLGL